MSFGGPNIPPWSAAVGKVMDGNICKIRRLQNGIGARIYQTAKLIEDGVINGERRNTE
jgi:hypothetical protein